MIITGEDKRIVMSGASSAWHDLLMFLLTNYAKPEEAQVVAKFFLLCMHIKSILDNKRRE